MRKNRNAVKKDGNRRWLRQSRAGKVDGVGEGVADRCGQFFSDSFKKKFKYCRLHFFNFEDSKPGPISGEKKGV